MSFKIYWTSLAEISFADELEYIFKKWNASEVGNFIVLTEEFFKILWNNPYIGKKIGKDDILSFAISAQTTLFYKVFINEERIDLLLFFNNKQDPARLLKLL